MTRTNEPQIVGLDTARRVLRHNRFELTEEQRDLQTAFAALFADKSPIERVRAAEPLGFDAELFSDLAGVEAFGIGVPENIGGAGGDLVDATVVVGEMGRRLAPVPLVDHMTAIRALARDSARSGDPSPALGSMLRGESVGAVALAELSGEEPQLVPAGAVADAILVSRGGLVELCPVGSARTTFSNFGRVPAALIGSLPRPTWRASRPGGLGQIVQDWRLLMASALIGVAEGALGEAVAYARERSQFGRPIGAFQAVAHPLADVAIAVEGGRRLVHKAAWYVDHEAWSAESSALVAMAFTHAARTANESAAQAVHVFGGAGLMEAPVVECYFRRAKGWALLGGDPTQILRNSVEDVLEVVSR